MLSNWIKDEICRFVETSPENTLKQLDEPAWKAPIVSIVAAINPLFAQFKELIGDFYWTPAEILEKVYPDETFSPEQISIVCWVLPQTDQTRADQRKKQELPADRWILSRHYGEFFNEALRRHVEELFRSRGIKAVAPVVHADFAYQKSPAFGLASNWSERHTAYAAGLGSFALCDGFITEAGKAVRIGSTVVAAQLEADNLPMKKLYGNCLHYSGVNCSACIRRCPVNAISAETAHDKKLCEKYIRSVTAPHAEKLLNAWQTPCGLCQVQVPCEYRNPVRI